VSAPLAVFLDGERIDPAQPAFSPLERGLLFGDGVFDTLRIDPTGAPCHAAHRARLQDAMARTGFRTTGALQTMPAVVAACVALVRAADPPVRRGALRVTITRGAAAGRGYAHGDDDGPPRCLAMLHAIADADLGRWHAGVRALADAWPTGAYPGLKTLSAAHLVAAQSDARRAGLDEALLLDADGNVLEAAGANVFFVIAGRLVTPAADLPLFPGSTAAQVCALEPAVERARIPLAMARGASEAFLTNAVRGITPLVGIHPLAIGTGAVGPVTARVRARYEAWIVEQLERPSPEGPLSAAP
jgi:branched-subunit amino acid aminotransferase/4-amino-4-deoxychorismate lyase